MTNQEKHGRGRRLGAAAALLAVLVTFTPLAGAQELKPFKNYLVTGDYVAAGVALRGKGVGGLAAGDIHIDKDQIPAGAEIVAAYLYWQVITNSGTPPNPDPALIGARFRGHELLGPDPGPDSDPESIAVRLGAGTSPCWSDGGATGAPQGSKVTAHYRADVLRFFPRGPDGPGGRVTVKVDGDHEVILPDQGNSNQLPSTLGAGLVIVYRVPGYKASADYEEPNHPLRYVVLYDGGFTLNNDTRKLELTIEGFFEAKRMLPETDPPPPPARLTQLVADGQSNKTERVQIRSTASPADNVPIGTNLFVANTGFEVLTSENLPLESGAMKATLTVDGGGSGSFDCLSWSSVVLSTEVQDADSDGLLDVWESEWEFDNKDPALSGVYSDWPLTDPYGNRLPDLEAMGADPRFQDVFVQIDYMTRTTTGSSHSHLPSRTALESVATAFRNAAPRPSLVAAGLCVEGAEPGDCPINIHFDVGDNHQVPAASWIVPAAVAEGGNEISERLCVAAPSAEPPLTCQFPDTPGVVRWKTGLRAFRDASRDGTVNGPARFSRTRKDIFRYGLFAHALGIPSLSIPSEPRKTSGIADSFGGDFMVTLGLWDNNTGTDLVQAATLMHELGHTFGLRHGGLPSNPIDPNLPEANCKPSYQSVMNYLFQVRGLLTWEGQPTLDYSRQVLPPASLLDETRLSERNGFGTQAAYRPRWFAPSGSSFIARELGTSPAMRRCDGSRAPASSSYVLVDSEARTDIRIDWNANGTISNSEPPYVSQDVNFDGETNQSLPGANDYWTMDLRQVGSRRAVGSQSLHLSVVDSTGAVGGGLSLDTGYGDLGYGDLGYGDLGYGDLGYGDLGYGDLGYGDLGYGDLGYGDLGYGDLGIPAAENAGNPLPAYGDLSLEEVGAPAPSSLTATRLSGKGGIKLEWFAPPAGTASFYRLYRVVGTTVTPTNFAQRVQLAPDVPGGTTSFTDTARLKNNTAYTYFVVATLTGLPECGVNCKSGVSNFATVVY